MRICIVYHIDPKTKGSGGVQRYLRNFINVATKNDIQIEMLKRRKEMDGILGLGEGKSTYNQNERIDSRDAKHWLSYLIELPGTMRDRRNNDVVFSVHRLEFVLPFLFTGVRKRVVLIYHGERLGTARNSMPSPIFAFINIIYFILEEIVFTRANRIITVSSQSSRLFSRIHPAHSSKFVTIPTAVDTKKFHPRNLDSTRDIIGNEVIDEPIILFAGIIRPVKNLPFLIDVFQIVHEKRKEVKLILIGNGEEKERIRMKVKEMGLEGSVNFIDSVDQDSMPEMLRNASVLLLTSKSEGSPTIVKEALASGVPVVASDVGDIRDILEPHPLAGAIIKDFDESEFAERILEVINRPVKERALVVKECREAIRSYDIEEIFERVILEHMTSSK